MKVDLCLKMNLEPTISFRGGSEGEGVCVGGAKLDMLTGHIFRNGQYKTRTAGCGLGIKCGLQTM